MLLDYAQTKAFVWRCFTKSQPNSWVRKVFASTRLLPRPYWTVLQSSGGQPMEKVKEFGGDTPLGRPGQPLRLPAVSSRWPRMNVHSRPAVWCSDGGDGVISKTVKRYPSAMSNKMNKDVRFLFPRQNML